MYILEVPLRVLVTKTKWFSLNLNQYRNTHFQVLNKSKVAFKLLIREQVDVLPKFSQVKLTLTLFPKTQRKCDLDNVLSIVTKYTQDVLVTSGKLWDDDYTCIPELNFRFGEVDKLNPRVVIQIEDF
jgi:hypothetical protein